MLVRPDIQASKSGLRLYRYHFYVSTIKIFQATLHIHVNSDKNIFTHLYKSVQSSKKFILLHEYSSE